MLQYISTEASVGESVGQAPGEGSNDDEKQNPVNLSEAFADTLEFHISIGDS